MLEEAAQPENPRWIIAAIRRLGNLPLFHRDAPITSTRAIIGWWEARRVPYNMILGGTGIFTCIVITVVAMGSYFLFDSDFGLSGSPFLAMFGIIIYGILANVCFTGGWLTELIVRRVWPQEADRFATTSFSLGLLFSVLLTLAPAILVGVGGLFGLASHFLGLAHH